MRKFIDIVDEGLLNMPRGGTRTEVRIDKNILSNPSFKAWFAGSQVCDHDGNPLVCYHGTFFDFTKFHHEDKGQGAAGSGFNRLGFWFDTDPGVPNWLAGYSGPQDDGYDAASEDGVVYPFFLSIKKPFVMDSEWLWDEDRDALLALKAELEPLHDIYYNGKRTERGNKLNPDGSWFDEQAYKKKTEQLQKMRDDLLKKREDGWWRIIKALPRGINSSTEEVAEFQAGLIREGYDGIYIGDTVADFGMRDYKVSDWWLAFYPNQIKSIYNRAFTNSDHMHESKV